MFFLRQSSFLDYFRHLLARCIDIRLRGGDAERKKLFLALHIRFPLTLCDGMRDAEAVSEL